MHIDKKMLTMLAFAVPAAAHAQWLRSFGIGMLEIFDYLIPTLVGVALIIFIWGVVRFIATDDEKVRSEGKKSMAWGLVILFVTVSMWGLVRLAQQIIGVRGGGVEAPYVDYTYE